MSRNTESETSKNTNSSEVNRCEQKTRYSRNTFLFGCRPWLLILVGGLVGFTSWYVKSIAAPEETDRLTEIRERREWDIYKLKPITEEERKKDSALLDK